MLDKGLAVLDGSDVAGEAKTTAGSSITSGAAMSNAVAVLPTQLQRRSLTRRPAPVKRRERLSPQAALRSVMSRYATGVTVLTAGHGANCHGMTANAFTSVSLEPPLVLCCVSRAARMHEVIMNAQSFAVSILGADQQSLAKYFADWRRPRGISQFDDVLWTRGSRTGAPLLAGSLAWLECELVKVFDGGDHSIFMGEVLTARHNEELDEAGDGPGPEALVFVGCRFHQAALNAA